MAVLGAAITLTSLTESLGTVLFIVLLVVTKQHGDKDILLII